MNTQTHTNHTNQSPLPDSGNNSVVWTIVAFAVIAILAYATYNYYSNDYVAYTDSGNMAAGTADSNSPASDESTLGD